MALSSKKKYTFLTVETKLNILEKWKCVITCRDLWEETSTISDIKVKRAKLEQFASKLACEEGTLKRKTARSANNKALEDALYVWSLKGEA